MLSLFFYEKQMRNKLVCILAMNCVYLQYTHVYSQQACLLLTNVFPICVHAHFVCVWWGGGRGYRRSWGRQVEGGGGGKWGMRIIQSVWSLLHSWNTITIRGSRDHVQDSQTPAVSARRSWRRRWGTIVIMSWCSWSCSEKISPCLQVNNKCQCLVIVNYRTSLLLSLLFS